MNLTAIQWQSLIRGAGIAIGSVLAFAGLTTVSQVGAVVDVVVREAPGIITSVSALVTAGMAVWGVISHSNASNIAAVKDVGGQAVVVSRNAPVEAQKMAADPDVKKVEFVKPSDPLAAKL